MASKYVDERLIMPTQYTPGKIGVVTVLYNSACVLDGFFSSIEAQTYQSFLVFCVDNASTDASAALCRERGGHYVVLENDINLGVPAANNAGIHAAIADGCEFVLFLNNDVVFGPELFEQLINGLERHGCAMTTPLMYYFDQPERIWAAGGYFQFYLGNRCLHYGADDLDRGQYAEPRPVGYTPTCCVLVRRELFATIGLMDERYFAYYDDTDFMLRAHRAGEQLYLLPYARLWHKVSSLIGTSSPFRTRYVYRNHALYVHKHLGTVFAFCVSLLYCAGYLFLSLIHRISLREARQRIGYWHDGMKLATAHVSAEALIDNG